MVKSFTDINKALSHLPLCMIFMCKKTDCFVMCWFACQPVASVDDQAALQRTSRQTVVLFGA